MIRLKHFCSSSLGQVLILMYPLSYFAYKRYITPKRSFERLHDIKTRSGNKKSNNGFSFPVPLEAYPLKNGFLTANCSGPDLNRPKYFWSRPDVVV